MSVPWTPHASTNCARLHDEGIALQEQGSLQAAAEKFRLARELHPQFAFAHCNEGCCLFWMGEHDAAIECLRRGLALYHKDGKACLHLAMALIAKGSVKDAVDTAQRAVDSIHVGDSIQMRQDCEAVLSEAKELAQYTAPDGELPSVGLRFHVGDRVECRVSSGWQHGTVVRLWFAEPGWGYFPPYQVQLDSGKLIFARADKDVQIRASTTLQLLDDRELITQHPLTPSFDSLAPLGNIEAFGAGGGMAAPVLPVIPGLAPAAPAVPENPLSTVLSFNHVVTIDEFPHNINEDYEHIMLDIKLEWFVAPHHNVTTQLFCVNRYI